jgi:phosphoglycerate dehydrogenase-like enzyme
MIPPLKIISFASKNPDRQEELRQGVKEVCADREYKLIFCETEDETAEQLRDAEILFSHQFSPAMLKHASKLRWIQRTDAGMEKTLFPELIASDIILTNARGFHARPIAEWTLGVLLYISQRLQYVDQWRRDRQWKPNKTEIITNRFTLIGKRALIVGWGEIGRPLGELLMNFGMKCEAVATSAKTTAIPVHDVKHLTHIISGFDIVVITVPYTQATHDMFDRSLLSKMKTGSILVNLARGKILDEAALIDALRSGPLAFAALDVFREEPLPEDSPLFDLPNLVMTPHVSGNFPEYTIRAHELFLENLRRYLAGEPLKFVVDKARGY